MMVGYQPNNGPSLETYQLQPKFQFKSYNKILKSDAFSQTTQLYWRFLFLSWNGEWKWLVELVGGRVYKQKSSL